jgi:diacylglycerol O-acyltransferase / wax synthase
MDVMFLCGETPSWHMHVCGLLILDPTTAPGGFDAARLRELLVARVAMAPQLGWKLREAPLGVDRPVFVEDPEFDPADHFHHVDLPAPGGRRELAAVVGDIAGRKLDRARPLWEIWIVEGLDRGRVAVVTKIHHSIIDGASGVDLAVLLMDASPEPRPVGSQASAPVGPAPSSLALVGRGAVSALTAPVRMARYGEQVARQAVVLGRSLLGHTSAGLPFQAPPTSFNHRLTAHRSFAFADVALADVVRVKDAFGVTMNDVALALVAGTLRRYLGTRGAVPDRPLIAQVPVSLRSDVNRAEIGTRVGTMFASLATHIDDPVERLLAIHRSTEAAKELRRRISTGHDVSLADALPPPLVRMFASTYSGLGLEEWVPPIFNLIVSTIRGPAADLTMGGARVLGAYPLGPLIYGSGLNVTACSLGRSIHFGFVACAEHIPDPWSIADGVPPALAELMLAADAPAGGTREDGL